MQQLVQPLLFRQPLEAVLAEVADGKFRTLVEQRVRRVRQENLPAVTGVAVSR